MRSFPVWSFALEFLCNCLTITFVLIRNVSPTTRLLRSSNPPLARVVSASPIDSRAFLCFGKSEARDRDRALIQGARALLSLTAAPVKNPLRLRNYGIRFRVRRCRQQSLKALRSVVGEEAGLWPTYPYERLARHIRPEFRRTLLEQSGSPRNMFKGGFNSAPTLEEGRFGPAPSVLLPPDLLFHLLFANSVQLGSIARSFRPHRQKNFLLDAVNRSPRVFSIYMIRIGLRLVQMLGKNAC